ncbi:GNAT family N-acetyltransferase [Streptococcus uberis]|uniref:GNAT family N-acetyltransferase n=1 Tax=Streptococcus uberis TaxID=1349 RepID=UPI003D787352
MNNIIKKANINQAELLSKIAFESKKYWGYSDEFMEKCREDLTVTPNYIENNLVKVIYSNQLVAGFYAFDFNLMKLDALFVSPPFIGKKFGLLLMNDLIDELKDRQVKTFTLDSEPNALGFYKKMGAVKVGEITSSVDETRKLPLMSYEFLIKLLNRAKRNELNTL